MLKWKCKIVLIFLFYLEKSSFSQSYREVCRCLGNRSFVTYPKQVVLILFSIDINNPFTEIKKDIAMKRYIQAPEGLGTQK